MRLRAGEVRLRSREVRFCLADAPFRIDSGLLSLSGSPAVAFENFNLSFGHLVLATAPSTAPRACSFARANLLIVEHCRICPALTLSPSRTRTSRIRPLSSTGRLNSSPSILPLSRMIRSEPHRRERFLKR